MDLPDHQSQGERSRSHAAWANIMHHHLQMGHRCPPHLPSPRDQGRASFPTSQVALYLLIRASYGEKLKQVIRSPWLCPQLILGPWLPFWKPQKVAVITPKFSSAFASYLTLGFPWPLMATLGSAQWDPDLGPAPNPCPV